MKRFIVVTSIILPILIGGCSDDLHYNPYDAENPRTVGAPYAVRLIPGDSQIEVIWNGVNIAGIGSYKIYRAFGGPEAQDLDYSFIAEVPEEGKGEYRYVDSGLQNDPISDGLNQYYYYRISYVDTNGVETPDPATGSELWTTVKAAPSVPPDPVELSFGQPMDLAITILWTDYVAPRDIAGYRIYSADVASRDEVPDLQLVFEFAHDPANPVKPEELQYTDVNFTRDNTMRAYKVTAVDKFGVESRSRIFYGQTPNLPPSPPTGVQVSYQADLGSPVYTAFVSWRKGKEKDIAGYRIFGRAPTSTEWEWKKTINDPNTTQAKIQGERFVVDETGLPTVRTYTVTAFDDTPKEDGSYDESPLPEVILDTLLLP